MRGTLAVTSTSAPRRGDRERIAALLSVSPVAQSGQVMPSSRRISTIKTQRTILLSILSSLILGVCSGFATSNHEYGAEEYLTISNGTSPDKKFSIKAHGEGDLGYENFHLYLVDASTMKIIGPLVEIVDTLDTGSDAFTAKWSEDSKTVMIIYRVDRHAPLKSMTYSLANSRALPKTKKPVDVTSRSLEEHWIRYGSGYFNPDGSRKNDKKS